MAPYNEVALKPVHVENVANTRNSRVDLFNNTDALIDNPLAHLTPEQLNRDVTQFADNEGFTKILPLLQKGAQIARDPLAYRAVRDLTEDEQYALEEEIKHPFRQTKSLYTTIFLCSIGAALQGWDQCGMNSANLTMPAAFGLDLKEARDVWYLGAINSMPYFASALIGCPLSPLLNKLYARRGAIFFAALFCFASVIGAAFTQSAIELLICRLLLGIGMGIKASTVPVFAAESSPAAIRGSLVMGWQLWVAAGILLGFSANLAVYRVGGGGPASIAWRLQLGSAFLPAVPLMLGISLCPESPRYLIGKRNDLQGAWKALRRLRRHDLLAARDLYVMYAGLKLEKEFLERNQQATRPGKTAEYFRKSSGYFKGFVELFTLKRVRRASLAAFVVMLAQQLCGINVLMFYSGTLFRNFGADLLKGDAHRLTPEQDKDIQNALLISFGIGAINLFFGLPAVSNIDKYGRRVLLLFTFPCMAITLLIAGLCFNINDDTTQLGLTSTFAFLFVAFYSPGEGPVPFTYSAEAYPLSHRELGMSFSVAVNLFWAGILTIIFPPLYLVGVAGPTGTLAIFAGLNVVALAMIFLWVPETKQYTLEELDCIFSVPTRTHMKYQFQEVLPFVFRRYILRQDVFLVDLQQYWSDQTVRDSHEADTRV